MTQLIIDVEKNATLKFLLKLFGALDGVTVYKQTRKTKTQLDRACDEVRQGNLIEAKDAADVMRLCLE